MRSPVCVFAALTLLGAHAQAQTATGTHNFPILVNSTSTLTLAVSPVCGSLDSANFSEINTGVDLGAMKTLVTFGDSWTSTGSNGTIPLPPILHPPLPSAGAANSENRRASNGYIWSERLAADFNAKLLDYSWGGAIINNYAYNTTTPLNATGVQRSDFVAQAALFFLQGKYLDALVPKNTVYAVAFGINDDGQYKIGNRRKYYAGHGNLCELNSIQAVHELTRPEIQKLAELQAAGAQNFLIHGMYETHPEITPLQSAVFAYLAAQHASNPAINFAFVNLANMFGAIAANPAPFGYLGNATCLVSANTIVGGCDDPDHSVFYIPGHPSMETHGLINQYTQTVVNECLVS
ncbi:hypothetical protein HMN09_00369000 [Mycena chlorophos]|uniref:Carbohydrate esterase family 16 protein n=1 Tax=Mycena chlorophos TaxID=658473 RepID=A0A8H6TJB1_MYCCL|nr:hypothetical protein HMN09_00369000 [Mycena chlorophos]